MREGRSPSYFNPTEAVLVLDYISRLLGEGVRPEDNTRKTKLKLILKMHKTHIRETAMTI